MARTRDMLVDFAKAVLESEAFLMIDSHGICIDGWIEDLSPEHLTFLMKYRQEFLDNEVVPGEVTDGGVQGPSLRRP
jgi:hypothetical protein